MKVRIQPNANLIQSENIPESEFKITGGVDVAYCEEEAVEMRDYVDKINQLGINFGGIEIWEKEQCLSIIKSPRAVCAIHFPKAGQYYPAKTVFHLAQVCDYDSPF